MIPSFIYVIFNNDMTLCATRDEALADEIVSQLQKDTPSKVGHPPNHFYSQHIPIREK